jgi:acyl-coenzyme A synthetase/AMP-(fatty) acid ligase
VLRDGAAVVISNEYAITRGIHVSEHAVVGVSDTQFAQRLYAFVVPKPGVSSDELLDELRSYMRDNLARHKVPRSVEIVAELPRKATGKMVKKELVTRAAGGTVDGKAVTDS